MGTQTKGIGEGGSAQTGDEKAGGKEIARSSRIDNAGDFHRFHTGMLLTAACHGTLRSDLHHGNGAHSGQSIKGGSGGEACQRMTFFLVGKDNVSVFEEAEEVRTVVGYYIIGSKVEANFRAGAASHANRGLYQGMILHQIPLYEGVTCPFKPCGLQFGGGESGTSAKIRGERALTIGGNERGSDSHRKPAAEGHAPAAIAHHLLTEKGRIAILTWLSAKNALFA